MQNILGEKNFPMENYEIVFPDNKSLVKILDELSYGSRYMSVNMGSIFVIFMVTILGLIIVLVGHFIFPRWITKLKKILIWNFCIRLVLETAIEIIFCTILNLRFSQWNTSHWSEQLNYCFAIFFAGLYLTSPITISLFFCVNFKHLTNEKFMKTYGSLYDGLDAERGITLLFPILFIVRRAAFCWTALYLYKYPVLQLQTTLLSSTLIAIYLFHFTPYKTTFMNKLEQFNEVCTGTISIILLLVADPSRPSYKAIGSWIFIGIMGFMIAV